jgi:hypothetical protein
VTQFTHHAIGAVITGFATETQRHGRFRFQTAISVSPCLRGSIEGSDAISLMFSH